MTTPTEVPRKSRRRRWPACTHAPGRTCIDCAVDVFRARPATSREVVQLTEGQIDD